MPFFKSAFSRPPRNRKEPTPTPVRVVATNKSVDSWCRQMRSQPTRFVRKVEMCNALATGQDARGKPVDKDHLHTLLRVSLAPTSPPNGEEGMFLIERVLSAGGAYHSVTPISDSLSASGTPFHPNIHDRTCIVLHGSSDTLAQHLEVERTLEFVADDSSEPYLTLFQFAQVLELVSQTTKLICVGGDCKYQSRSFTFTCMAALTSKLPPVTPVGNAGEGLNDLLFEQGAEGFLKQIPWLITDPGLVQTSKLMMALKDEDRGKERRDCNYSSPHQRK